MDFILAFTDSGRVRVAVRLRPRNAEELLSDADFADCVELQPEVNNIWQSTNKQYQNYQCTDLRTLLVQSS